MGVASEMLFANIAANPHNNLLYTIAKAYLAYESAANIMLGEVLLST